MALVSRLASAERSPMSGVILAWLAAIVSNFDTLASSKKMVLFKWKVPKKVAGYALIIISTVALVWQWLTDYQLKRQLQETMEVVSRQDESLFEEASGGVAMENVAYIVDDERPILFKLEFNEDKSYRFKREIPLVLGPFRKQEEQNVNTTGSAQIASSAAICGSEIADKDCVDDFEAIAVRPSNNESIYMVTSHSNTQNGRPDKSRERLIEVSVKPGTEGQITKFQENLRSSIVKELHRVAASQQDQNLERLLQTMQTSEARRQRIRGIQVEGLAIDESDYAYLGLREPLVQHGGVLYAIVLRAKLGELFTDSPAFQTFLLNLDYNHNRYGIVSLDYDPLSNQMLVLGNHPEGKWFEPILCLWNSNAGNPEEIQTPSRCTEVKFNREDRISKPELVLLPPKEVFNGIFMFLDSDGKAPGGQIGPYQRSYFGLSD